MHLLQNNPTTQADIIGLGIELLIILGFGKLLSVLCRKLRPAIEPLLEKTGSLLLNSLFKTCEKPLRALILLFTGVFLCTTLFSFFSWNGLLSAVNKIQTLGTIFILSWLVFRWKKDVQAIYMEKYRGPGRAMDRATVDTVGHFLSIIFYFFTTILVLAAFDVNMTTLLAVTGAGTVAAGLAAKTIIENIFSGIMIYMTRPFSVDDLISTVDKKIEGTVIEIGWYMTLVLNKERQPIYIPNSLFTSLVVVNPSRMKNRYIEFDVGIRYNDFKSVEPIVHEVRNLLESHPSLEQDGSGMAHFLRFASSSLDINVQVYTKTVVKKEWRDIQQELMLKIGEIIEKHGAEIAFPTQTIIMENQFASIGGKDE